jgi:hypothetical protein
VQKAKPLSQFFETIIPATAHHTLPLQILAQAEVANANNGSFFARAVRKGPRRRGGFLGCRAVRAQCRTLCLPTAHWFLLVYSILRVLRPCLYLVAVLGFSQTLVMGNAAGLYRIGHKQQFRKIYVNLCCKILK